MSKAPRAFRRATFGRPPSPPRSAVRLALLAIAAVPLPLPAQAASTGPLEFLGFRPGASRAEVEGRVAAFRGTISCAGSAADRRFSECRGILPTGVDGRLMLTVSLVRDSAAIVIIRGPIEREGLDRWRDHLTSRYGVVPSRRDQGGQESWQWVRRGRMIRLVTRTEASTRIVSVTLVHGPLLDSLGPIPSAP